MIAKAPLGHVAAILTIVIWGTTFVSTKYMLQRVTPVEILFFRFVIGYVSLLLVFPRLLPWGGLRREAHYMGAGLCGVTLYFLLENIALAHTLASHVGVIIAVAPFFTAVLAHWLLDGERLHGRFFIGFAVAISGIALISFNGNVVLQLSPLGDLLAVLAAMVWAMYSILMRKISSFGYHTGLCTRRVFFYGLVFMLPALPLFGVRLELSRFAYLPDLLNILYLGFGASALCFVVWNWTVKILGAVKTSVYIYLVPVITVVSSALILHEQLTGAAMLGTALTLAGLLISESASFGNRHIYERLRSRIAHPKHGGGSGVGE